MRTPWFLRCLTACFFALPLQCTHRGTPEEEGAALASDPRFSSSQYNAFACTTCHMVFPGESDRILPGAPLAGTTRRTSFWGGAFATPADAVQECYRRFQRGGTLELESQEGRALYAWLLSISSAPNAVTTPVAFTIPASVNTPAAGDRARGESLYRKACESCHGEPRTGRGRLAPPRGEPIVLVPDATEGEHTRAMGYTENSLRTVFVQKIRHGSFLGFAGVMPPFSTEVLTDQDLEAIVTYLNPQLR